jgi:hypothetical protein
VTVKSEFESDSSFITGILAFPPLDSDRHGDSQCPGPRPGRPRAGPSQPGPAGLARAVAELCGRLGAHGCLWRLATRRRLSSSGLAASNLKV